MDHKRFHYMLLVLLLLASCSAPGQVSQAPALVPTPTRRPTFTPKPSATATPTQIPPTSTPTTDLTIYDFENLNDPRNLDSFVITNSYSHISASGVTETDVETYEYVKQPLTIHIKSKYNKPTFSSQGDKYIIGDWEYFSSEPGWGISKNNNIPSGVDIREDAGIYYFKSGTFVGLEDYDGVPVYHFTFDQADLIDSLGNMTIEKSQADLYVMVNGYYPIHFSATFSGNLISSPETGGFVSGVLEIKKDIAAINQQTNITLPADYPNFNLDPGVPLPEGVQLDSISYARSGAMHYLYQTTISLDDFLAFYKNIPPTDGWSVANIGPMIEPILCKACVLLTNGNYQVKVTWENEILVYVIHLEFPPH